MSLPSIEWQYIFDVEKYKDCVTIDQSHSQHFVFSTGFWKLPSYKRLLIASPMNGNILSQVMLLATLDPSASSTPR